MKLSVNKNNIRLSFTTSRAVNEVLEKILSSIPKGQEMTKSALVNFLVILGLEHSKLIANQYKEKEGIN